jgi:hypothetical protein
VKDAVAWSEKGEAGAGKKERDPWDATALQWAYIGILFLYILVMRHIGYGVATFAFCFILMTMLGPKTPKGICLNAVFSAITAVLLVYIFGTLLDLFLPG